MRAAQDIGRPPHGTLQRTGPPDPILGKNPVRHHVAAENTHALS